MKKEVKIPDIAENVESGLVAGILVSVGDQVEADQPLVEVETDKATTDIPSPFSGTISEIKVEEGDEVKVDQVIMIIDTGEEAEEGEASSSAEATEDRKAEAEAEAEAKAKAEAKAEAKEEEKKEEGKRDLSDIPAAPSVRRLAREMDVDLRHVEGSGPGNRITAEDVKSHKGKAVEKGKERPAEAIKLPDFSQWGSISRESMSNIRKTTARNVSDAWRTIPHVTQFDQADMTGLNEFMDKYREKISKQGGKLTVTAVLLKIAALALQKFPRFNASLDIESGEIIYKHYYHLGVAVDTPRGLVVPVIRDVNSKSLADLSVELGETAEKMRERKISLEDLQGGTFTISNLGGIGGTAFTPIVYPPQVAILGVSRASYQGIFIDGELEKRLVIPLSLSYDHRIIDGADGARFLRWICNIIEDPYAVIL
ncbi:MAG: dihydrolipoamide acetyltransferase family protein [Bacteroidota bacterium]